MSGKRCRNKISTPIHGKFESLPEFMIGCSGVCSLDTLLRIYGVRVLPISVVLLLHVNRNKSHGSGRGSETC